MPRRKRLYLACFLCHFLFIFLAGCRDLISFISRDYTWLPTVLSRPAQRVETALDAVLGDQLVPSNPVRQALVLYTRFAGIDSGYAFFAPNVPDNYKLVFEIHYPDGRVEYDLPRVSSSSAGLRLAVMLDYVGQTRSDELRELMIKMITYTIWREHPGAAMIRAVFGFAVLPTAEESRRGVRESDEFLYSYDFVLPPFRDGNSAP